MVDQSAVPSPGNRAKSEILIVEDEAVARRALVELLCASGFETRAVESAEDALRAIADGHRFHIALVDFNLPGMNGLDLIQRLRKTNPAIVSVLVTAQSRDSFSQCSEADRVLHVQKPIDFAQLLAIIGHKT